MLKWRVHGLRWKNMRITTKPRHSCTNIQSKHNDNHAVSLYEDGIVCRVSNNIRGNRGWEINDQFPPGVMEYCM